MPSYLTDRRFDDVDGMRFTDEATLAAIAAAGPDTVLVATGAVSPSRALVAVTSGNFNGYSTVLALGSLIPDLFPLVTGSQITAIASNLVIQDIGITIAGTHLQTFFTSLTIDGNTVLTAAATTFVSAGDTTWIWSGNFLLPAPGTYAVDIA